MAPKRNRSGEKKLEPIRITNTEMSRMNLDTGRQLRRLYGALDRKIQADTVYDDRLSLQIDSASRLFNLKSSIVLRSTQDPLFQVYQEIGATVPITWEPDLGPSDDEGSWCAIL